MIIELLKWVLGKKQLKIEETPEAYVPTLDELPFYDPPTFDSFDSEYAFLVDDGSHMDPFLDFSV